MAISRVIGCISAKGGVGKTTSAINLAAALHVFGKDVILVDANLTTPNVGVYLGVPIAPVTLHDVLRGKKDARDAVFQHRHGFKVLPASISVKDAKKVDPNKLDFVLKDIDGHSDFIILDGSPGLTKEALAVVKASNEVIIVTNPEMPAVTDALKTIKICRELKKEVLGVLVTKTNAKNADMPLKDIENILDVPVMGIIPEDRAVKFAVANKEPVVHNYPKSPAAVQYKKLAAELLNIKYSERIEPLNTGSFFDSILKWLGFKD
ncbi:cell division ATPase MinD [Candidatus Woesearchaeota archaeon]|nr:cell division ATPase MinD [Candidatus Woesearchaeota archaeon]